MEPYINNNVSDITYMSELSLTFYIKCQGSNSHSDLCSLCSISRVLINFFT